jgi:hypothetical protein
MRKPIMSLQELEAQLLKLDPADRAHLRHVLDQSLQPLSHRDQPAKPVQNLADLFRNSALVEALASGELDLTRNQTIDPEFCGRMHRPGTAG